MPMPFLRLVKGIVPLHDTPILANCKPGWQPLRSGLYLLHHALIYTQYVCRFNRVPKYIMYDLVPHC